MRGFTLVELLIVIAIIAIVATFSLPYTQSFQFSTDLESLSGLMVKSVRKAQRYATSGYQNADWGVKVDEVYNNVIIFRGSDFATRDQSFDTVLEHPASFQLNSTFTNDEFYFSQYSGMPSASGTINLISPGNQTAIIRVNGYGKIERDK